METLMLTVTEAQKFVGVGITEWYKLVKLPGFPKRKPGTLKGKPQYLASELENWAYNLKPYERPGKIRTHYPNTTDINNLKKLIWAVVEHFVIEKSEGTEERLKHLLKNIV
jgi:hypothetical protein